MTDDPSDSSHDNLFKHAIRKYVRERLQEGMKVNNIEAEMRKLCYELLVVPTSLCDWTIEIVKELHKKYSVQPQSPSSSKDSASVSNYSTETTLEKMDTTEFKEMLYHALLCCEAVNQCDSKSYSSLFRNNGNTFSEVSISICNDQNVDRYIIAKQRSVVFISFLSEPFISDWLEKHPSFESGEQSSIRNMY